MKKYTFIVPMDVEYNFYSKNIKTAIETLLMNHNDTIKGEVWNDIHKITGTEGYSGSTIIETDIDKKEKTYHLINNKPKLLKEQTNEQRG